MRLNLNPVFNQEFEFTGLPGIEMIRKQMLLIKVMEQNKLVDSFIYQWVLARN